MSNFEPLGRDYEYHTLFPAASVSAGRGRATEFAEYLVIGRTRYEISGSVKDRILARRNRLTSSGSSLFSVEGLACADNSALFRVLAEEMTGLGERQVVQRVLIERGLLFRPADFCRLLNQTGFESKKKWLNSIAYEKLFGTPFFRGVSGEPLLTLAECTIALGADSFARSIVDIRDVDLVDALAVWGEHIRRNKASRRKRRRQERSKPRLKRQIEFPAEFMGAGVTMLGHFSKYLKRKYPEVEAAVRITQSDLHVTLEVETADGNVERVSHSLEEYGLVWVGEKRPEDFLPDDQIGVLQLKNDLAIAEAQLRSERNALQLQAIMMDDQKGVIQSLQVQNESLQVQNERLGELLGASLAGQQALPKLIENLVDRIAAGVLDPVAEMGTVGKMFGPAPSLDKVELVRGELEVARERDPQKYARFVENVMASGTATTLTWVTKLIIGG